MEELSKHEFELKMEKLKHLVESEGFMPSDVLTDFALVTLPVPFKPTLKIRIDPDGKEHRPDLSRDATLCLLSRDFGAPICYGVSYRKVGDGPNAKWGRLFALLRARGAYCGSDPRKRDGDRDRGQFFGMVSHAPEFLKLHLQDLSEKCNLRLRQLRARDEENSVSTTTRKDTRQEG